MVVTPAEHYQASGGGYVQDTGTSVSNTFTVPSYSGISSTITDNIYDFVTEQFSRIPTITPITYQLIVASEKTDGSVTVNYHNGTGEIQQKRFRLTEIRPFRYSVAVRMLF